jgi:hypothetical protein
VTVTAAVPEPATPALFLAGLLGIASFVVRSRALGERVKPVA